MFENVLSGNNVFTVLDESHSSLLDLGSQDLPDDEDQEVNELN